MIDEKHKTIWPRLLARLIDGVPFWILGLVLWRTTSSKTLVLLGVFLEFVYHVLMLPIAGQTFGKMLTGIQVKDNKTNNKLSFKQSIVREALFRVSEPQFLLKLLGLTVVFPKELYQSTLLKFSPIIWFVANYIFVLSNFKRRSFYDYLAGSVVEVEESMIVEQVAIPGPDSDREYDV